MKDGIDARLRMARAYAKLRQADLAVSAGIGLSTVQRIESGRFEPRQGTVRKLADALGVRPEWLLTGEGPMQTEEGEPKR